MNKSKMHRVAASLLIWGLAVAFIATPTSAFSSESAAAEVEPEKGPNRGRLLKQDGFAVELSIFETGVPPEFRVWTTFEDRPVDPQKVELLVQLTRLGDVIDTISFKAQGDFLRGDLEVYEPHSFVVSVKASYDGKSYQWQYDNLEGRTRIEAQVAEAMNIVTGIAGDETLVETVELFGRIVASQDAQRNVTARFDGQIKSMPVSLWQTVKRGDVLATIESDESLKSYTIKSPIDGVITSKAANVDEQTGGRILMSITNPQMLTAELSVFPSDRLRVKPSAQVTFESNESTIGQVSSVASIDSRLQSNQSIIARVPIDNSAQRYFPGQYVTANVEVDRYTVPLAVKRSGLQAFRDFTVVYAKVGEEYEVRMLELGRTAGDWVEVLGGLDSGTEYVTENSFIIKADIEKSGASHDH